MIRVDSLPSSPGCYMFKDEPGVIIYVGKAGNLKKRVSSYFSGKNLDAKTAVLVSRIKSVDYIVTNTEVEALILENSLIKRYKPKYNIDLKDSKTYAYIKVTKEDYPRVLIARLKDDDGLYFGPFVSAEERDNLAKLLKKTFKIRTCKRMPKRECLKYQINLCSAPCTNRVSKEEYNKSVNKVVKVLSGNTAELISELKEELSKSSKNKDYERALRIRDELKALDYLSSKQSVERDKSYDEDVINYAEADGRVYLMLFNIKNGLLSGKEEFVFDYLPGFFSQFLVQYYSDNLVPKEVIVPEQVDDSLPLFLEKLRGSKVIVAVPKRGVKKGLLELVLKNIETVFFEGEIRVKQLQESLGLPIKPSVIECFDISHLSGTLTAGSMVRFVNGKPDKSNYRRFKVRGNYGVDDYKAIAEVVKRRYSRLKLENKVLPDLIVIDGGKGQLSSALNALKDLGVKSQVISLAKGDEEVFVPNNEKGLKLEKKSKGLLLLQAVRDEAHRFAINYNKLLRSKRV